MIILRRFLWLYFVIFVLLAMSIGLSFNEPYNRSENNRDIKEIKNFIKGRRNNGQTR